ncbi:nuclear transport factor 2 family protein [Streptomyces sp. NPDC048639]|uniref:nuclear transport factor 2 family protein n=1 Tax=Streptomyces sp. NPDC048639 TaxID=3365581 RepID=UPI00371BA0FE
MPTHVERFLEHFTEIWARPKAERFPELYHEDATLLHPGMPRPLTRSEVADYMTTVLAGAPDIHLTPNDWASRGDVLYIDSTVHATVAGQATSWPVVDKIVLRGDKAAYIQAYFDSHPLWVAIEPSMARSSELERVVAEKAALAG